MVKRKNKSCITLFLLTVFGVLLSSCGSPKSKIMRECRVRDIPKAVCSCVYQRLEKRFGDKTLKEIDNYNFSHASLEEFQEASIDAVSQCTGIKIR